jgi:hypothetical protein
MSVLMTALEREASAEVFKLLLDNNADITALDKVLCSFLLS